MKKDTIVDGQSKKNINLKKASETDSMISKSPKTNITLETDLIDEIKRFIKEKKKNDTIYPHRTPTALIREAIRVYISPDNEIKEAGDNIEELMQRVEAIEKSRETVANEEQNIYVRCVAMLLNIFEPKHDFYESFKIAKSRLDESNITPLEFREFSRIEIEHYFLDHLANPPNSLGNLVQENKILQLLMMFLFLCNLGFTRKQDIIDPSAPMSTMFIESLKKIVNQNS